jgi:hypothetical protein
MAAATSNAPARLDTQINRVLAVRSIFQSCQSVPRHEGAEQCEANAYEGAGYFLKIKQYSQWSLGRASLILRSGTSDSENNQHGSDHSHDEEDREATDPIDFREHGLLDPVSSFS